MKSNEQILSEFIKEQNAKALTVEWVLWMLDLLKDARENNKTINPDWFWAEYRNYDDPEPPMIYES